MKYVVKGRPYLSLDRRQVKGFQYVDEPILRLILIHGVVRECYMEIDINKELMTFDDILVIKHFIEELNIYDPKNKDFVHFIREIYKFHGFNLEEFTNDDGMLEGINILEIEEYIKSLSELELEIEEDKGRFTYKITNMEEDEDYSLKESLMGLFILL